MDEELPRDGACLRWEAMNFSGTCECWPVVVPGVLSSRGVSMEKWDGLVDPKLGFFRQVGWKPNGGLRRLAPERHVMDNDM